MVAKIIRYLWNTKGAKLDKIMELVMMILAFAGKLDLNIERMSDGKIKICIIVNPADLHKKE